jgi:hypothetical protein
LSESKPAFHSVVDLGLRDVGVKNEPRRLAAHFGKSSIPTVAVAVISAFLMCAILSQTGAGAWILVPFGLVWIAGVLAFAVRIVNRSPLVVVRVSADGTNQAVWLMIAPSVLLAAGALVLGDPLLIPVIALTAIMVPLTWRARRRVPEALAKLRTRLAAEESVLGDGIGVARDPRDRRDPFRLVVATDRRLLVTDSGRSTERFVLVDVPYRRVNRFGIEWPFRGRVGTLSLTVAGIDAASSDAYTITSIAPANLVSIAQALESHGVQADDPDRVAEAERGWQEAQREAESRQRGEPRKPLRQRLLDREAMGTRDFDRGLWLLLGVSALTLYLNPFGVGLAAPTEAAVPLLLTLGALCLVCGWVSGTKSSLAYIAPLNLLITPAFFFVDASAVISGMLVLSAIAAACLWAGSALGRAAGGARGERPARGTRRYAVSGLGLTRISTTLLAALLALVAISTAAGFELTSLRLAVEEATAKKLPVDGRSNLTGNAASLSYTPRPDLKELVRDEHFDGGPNDGARWEVRTSFTEGYNGVSLAHYIFEPRLDDSAAVEDFVAQKDREHAHLAGRGVTHTERVVDGRKGYVWDHGSRSGFWYYAAWFPQPVHTVRVECVARTQRERFERLCAEAMRSLEFH